MATTRTRSSGKRETAKRGGAAPKGENGKGNGNGDGAKGSAKPKAAPKPPPTYGGKVGEPDFGARARRLIGFLSEHLAATKVKQIVADAVKATPDDDRIVRFQYVLDAAKKNGVTSVKVEDTDVELNQALVRRLGNREGAVDLGKKGSVKDYA